MTNFGDLEAHRRILEEIRACDSAAVLMACLRAVAMSAFGSFHGLDTLNGALPSLRHTDDGVNLRAVLSVASVTATFSQGIHGLSEEMAHSAATLEGELSRIAHTREQSTASASARHVNVSFGAAMSTVEIGSAGSSSSLLDYHAKLDAQCELTVYMQAYLQFMRGFLELWDELFGRHYSFPRGTVSTGLYRPPEQDGNEAGRTPSRDDRHSSTFVHHCSPPHLYAVNWKCVLTPARREWIASQQEMTQELLFRVVARELPLEAYLVFQLHAVMSLRLRLLEAVAQLFVWSSCYIDVNVCVQQLYTNYRLQCEVARLQDLWASFKLFDAEFANECATFNSTCSEDQGAVIEHMFFDTSNMTAAPAQASTTVDTSAASAADGERGRETPRVPTQISEEFQASSADDSASVASSRSAGAETGVSSTAAAVVGTRREVYTPLFPTRCHFTWLLQRACWSMYGRSSLLFSSCLHAERVYDAAPLLRPPPTIAELSVGNASATVSHRPSYLDASRPATPGSAAKRRNPSEGNVSVARGPAASSGRPTVTKRDTTEGALPVSGRLSSVLSSRQAKPPSPNPLPTPLTSSATADARSTPSSTNAAVPTEPSVAANVGTSSNAASQEPHRRRSTSGWRGMLQSLLLSDRHNEPPRTAPPPAAPSTGTVGSTSSPTPLPSGGRGTVSQAATATACVYDSRAEPVSGQAPFFFHYDTTATTLDQDVTPRQGEAVAVTESNEARPSIDYVFLKRCGCYVLALAIRKALEAQRYPATLVVVTNNTTREGRVHWRHNRITPLTAQDDASARTGIAPWVLNFVFPGSRLSSDPVARDQQERRLFQTIVFQIAGADDGRVCFPAYHSLFFALNSGPLFDSGRVYFVMHLSMPDTEAQDHYLGRHPEAKAVREAAYAGLEEIYKGWAMHCSCNEALRLLPCAAPLTYQA